VIELDVLSGGSGAGRRVDLASYLDAAAEERAHEEEYAWIKSLRHLRVDGEPFRSRFTFKGDSLWWFAELYLHKERRILQVFRALAAFDAFVERERPAAVRFVSGRDPGVVAQAAAARRVRYSGPSWRAPGIAAARIGARASALAAAARLGRSRARPAPAPRPRVAAFVHRAFWRPRGADEGDESYIGPVLRALESRVGRGDIRYVGLGARANFRARRWWDPIVDAMSGGRAGEPGGVVAIERFAGRRALAPSRALYRARHEMLRALWQSADLRAHAAIRGCDCWPLVQEQLAGVALLQWPWSARAMDEAAAALDALDPDVAVTYAEAGGWGRALALECRRRRIPLAGLQHGFIYRHWLNYRHEPDEMLPDARSAADGGFPRPDLTLLFDEQAERHLTAAGAFPPSALAVTGSPRRDELIAAVRALGPDEAARARRDAGAGERALVLFAAKEREARPFIPALIEAVRDMPDLQLVVKPHPAETAEVYASAAARAPNVAVVEPAAPLPPLLAAARAIVTVNSTVAIDALPLGVPSLVMGLPNNLSPFVERGAMLGAGSAGEIRAALQKLLYNQEFRSTIAHAADGLAPSGGESAARSADAILALAGRAHL
jgi:hypothetical protein